MDGYFLMPARRIWSLNLIGDISANSSVTISRNSMPMSLNNDGDLISLINSGNHLVDQFQYISSIEGQIIDTGH